MSPSGLPPTGEAALWNRSSRLRGERRLAPLQPGRLLAPLQLLQRLVDDLGLAHQVVAHDRLDLIGRQLDPRRLLAAILGRNAGRGQSREQTCRATTTHPFRDRGMICSIAAPFGGT